MSRKIVFSGLISLSLLGIGFLKSPGILASRQLTVEEMKSASGTSCILICVNKENCDTTPDSSCSTVICNDEKCNGCAGSDLNRRCAGLIPWPCTPGNNVWCHNTPIKKCSQQEEYRCLCVADGTYEHCGTQTTCN